MHWREELPKIGGPLAAATAINAFQNVKTTLPQAIQAAEQHSNGKAFDVSFSDQGGTPVYMIDTFHNNTVWQGEADAGTGKVVGQARRSRRANSIRRTRPSSRL